MKILILEDEIHKLAEIKEVIHSFNKEIIISDCANFGDFCQLLERDIYNLIIVDLVAPPAAGMPTVDLSGNLINNIRENGSKNINTPVLAMTQFAIQANENYKSFNESNITIINYAKEDEKWKSILKNRINENFPIPNFDFIIFCALKLEADAFIKLNLASKELKTFKGLDYHEINISDCKGIVIIFPKMGLVDAAITVTRAIEFLQPKLICMSGICAGIKENTKIYDLIIPTLCYQHDSGKWTSKGFIGEPYQVLINKDLLSKIRVVLSNTDLITKVLDPLTSFKKRSIIPEDQEDIEPIVQLGVCSSGSSVVADEMMNQIVELSHRKIISFEMENYALYEAARLSSYEPLTFAVKCVVDSGSSIKNDTYQDFGSQLAASFVYNMLENLLPQIIEK